MDYKSTLKTATTRLDALQGEYAAMERKLADTGQEINRLAEVINGLALLAGEKVTFNEVITELLQSVRQSEVLEVGITERIRQILESKPTVVFLPTAMRTELEGVKYDLAKHSNAMATIHGVLKRLVEQQQAVAIPQPDGKVAYKWNSMGPKR